MQAQSVCMAFWIEIGLSAGVYMDLGILLAKIRGGDPLVVFEKFQKIFIFGKT